ncbi:MAG TPA: hypothetical protein VFC73_06830 [Syntrophomonadaceae bacterium]|nr:hypothetical protein [Syntrophomonadaceae bacterium]
MEVNVSVTAAEPFDEITQNSFLDITFTNTDSFTYVAGNVYYYALLTDSSDPDALTQEVTFKIDYAEGGTVEANTSQSFTIENTQNLVPDVSGGNGRILYNIA